MANTPEALPLHNVRDGWVFTGLLMLVVWAPLPLGSNRYWAIGLLLLFSLVLLAGAIAAWRHALALASERLHIYRWPLALLGGMVVWSWLQCLPLPAQWVQTFSPMAALDQAPASQMTLSLDAFQSRTMASLAFAYFALFFVVVMTVRDTERLDRLAQVMVWSGVLQAFIGAVLYSVQAEYRIFFVPVSHLRMIGTFVYHNSLAGYLCMCLSVGIGLMLSRLGNPKPRRKQHWKAHVVSAIAFMLSPKMRLRLLLIVMVIALVLTRSRMGNAALFVSMVTVGLLAILVARKNAPQTIVLIASLIIIDVLVVGTWVGLERVVERIQQTELADADGGKSESVEARTEAARTALPIIADYPVFGTGGGSFYNIFLSYRTTKYGYTYVDHTHNDFVEIATDYGLVGLALLGTLVALSLVTAIKTLAQRKARLPWGIAFGVTMAIVALLFHSAVDFNLQIPANAMTIVIILAMGWIARYVPAPKGVRRPSEKPEP
jgi:O-antigen ligase